MKIQKLWKGAASLILLAPATAIAQNNVIILAPAGGTPAPALAGPMLILLAALLAGIAVRTMRSHASTAVAMALLSAVTLTAGIASAGRMIITLQGADCSERSIHPFESSAKVVNDCPNAMRIVEIECDESNDTPRDATPYCETGAVLESGAECIVSCYPG